MTAVAKADASALAQVDPGANPVIELLRFAVANGVSPESLERLQALHERVADRNARAAFFDALARFQEMCPPIGYSRKVNYVTKDGQPVKYGYAELPHIARTIAPWLKAVGLSYAWDAEVKGEQLITTCILRHIDGHSEKSTFAVPTGSGAGMSPAQKVGAAGTYSRRQTLVQVLGLTTCDADTDGVEDPPIDVTPITEDQLHDLESLIEESGRPMAKMLAWLKVEKLAVLPAARFDAVCREIRDVMVRERDAKAKKEKAS